MASVKREDREVGMFFEPLMGPALGLFSRRSETQVKYSSFLKTLGQMSNSYPRCR